LARLIITTAVLAFSLIKAFALLNGYDIVVILRIPPCVTLAFWLGSVWASSSREERSGIHFDADMGI
jgi:hypothetical protein